jgi:hypothetical protein
MAIAPLLLYVACFLVLTFPLATQFNSLLFTDNTDGYQMLWDLWWVRYALLDLHQNPFFTHYVHYPTGTSLLLHSLMPLNGILAIPLAMVLSKIQAFNVLVILAFATSGLAAFWLCWGATRHYWASLAGGFSFAFCSYRWAHYHGHLHLIESGWMALYIAALLYFLKRPKVATAIPTAVLLMLILLCDQYHFLFSVVATTIVLIWWPCADGGGLALLKRHAFPLSAFILAALLTSGPIVLAMARRAARFPLLREHNPDLFSCDMLAPWVPDWTWAYSSITRSIWQPFMYGSPQEKGLCIGPAVLVASLFAFIPRVGRPRFALGSPALFALLAIAFLGLSFGPVWRFGTVPVTSITPYNALISCFPPARSASSVSRFIVMTQLCLAVLAASGLSRISTLRSPGWRTLLTLVAASLLVLEAQPCVLLACSPDPPKWVLFLRDAPLHGAVIDLIDGARSTDLYYQTIHHRPIAMGEISRISADVQARTDHVLDAVNTGHFQLLSQEGFAYIVTIPPAPPLKLPICYTDQAARIYALPPTTSP